MRVSLILRAVATSWVAVVANASVGIFLSPYVLHRLGDEAFGVWVLIVNLVGYYGILDAGVRSAILRYVSRHKGLNEQKKVNEVLASAFYYYLGACILVILATHLSVDPLSRFFSIHSQVLGEEAGQGIDGEMRGQDDQNAGTEVDPLSRFFSIHSQVLGEFKSL